MKMNEHELVREFDLNTYDDDFNFQKWRQKYRIGKVDNGFILSYKAGEAIFFKITVHKEIEELLNQIAKYEKSLSA